MPTPPVWTTPLKVFIADDSATVRERLVTMLDDVEGIEVVGQAQDVPEAIRDIREVKPDVVILDIRMPGGTGIDVLRDLKSESESPKIIMLTNYPYIQYRQRCLEAGADFFFDKSTEFDKIPRVFEELRQSPAA